MSLGGHSMQCPDCPPDPLPVPISRADPLLGHESPWPLVYHKGMSSLVGGVGSRNHQHPRDEVFGVEEAGGGGVSGARGSEKSSFAKDCWQNRPFSMLNKTFGAFNASVQLINGPVNGSPFPNNPPPRDLLERGGGGGPGGEAPPPLCRNKN